MSSIGAPPFSNLFAVPPWPVRKFTVAEYHQLIQAGILTENDPVELIEGWIVPKMPHNPPHDGTVDNARERVERLLPTGWRVRVQSAITTADSEPEPDVVVVPSPASLYYTRHPEPHEIAVVIEVAESSLARDRGEKCRSYARACIVCYWIINLVHRQVEVYTDPTGPTGIPSYRQRIDYGPTDSVPLVIAGQQVGLIPVADLLP
ncbi:MAG TPA: Uma2 family endonuclease [Gemmataceae bacterium]|nr:Uma2 family endonuclease [Gemmataceae bacterium]